MKTNILKKLIITLIISLIGVFSIWITNTFAYQATKTDQILLKSLRTKIEKINTERPKVLPAINMQIKKMLLKYNKDSRIYYLLEKISFIITDVITPKEKAEDVINKLFNNTWKENIEKKDKEKSKLEEEARKNNEQYNGIYDQNHNLINRCKLYKMYKYKWVNNLETYTCDSITNVLNLDYHWHDFNPNADWTLYLILTNNDRSGDLELYVKNYWTLKWINGSQIFFKVPNVKKWKTISYRISWKKWTNYYLRIDFNKKLNQNSWQNISDNNNMDFNSKEFLEKHPGCTQNFRELIKKNKKDNANLNFKDTLGKWNSTSIWCEPCTSQEYSCLDNVKKDYLGNGKYAPCYVWTDCWARFNKAQTECSNKALDCKSKFFCWFIIK